MAELRLDRVGKSFGSTTAVHELSLDIASGEFIVLLASMLLQRVSKGIA